MSRQEIFEGAVTQRKRASTSARNAVARLRNARDAARPTEHELRWLVGYEASRLIEVLADAIEELAPMITDPELIEEPERAIKAAAKRIREVRLADALSNVEGRTPEEADAFRAKAAELVTR